MKKVLSLLLAAILVISNISMVFAELSDVDTHWAKEEVNYMVEKEVIKGYPDGTFKPNDNMKKSEFYTVINGLMGFTELGEVAFEDVAETAWFYAEVQKGVGAEYILPGTTLEPAVNITRGEVARIIVKVFEIELNEAAAEEFTDHESFGELKATIGGLKNADLVAGFPDGNFGAEGEITRAEVVKMLHSAYTTLVEIEDNVEESAEEVEPTEETETEVETEAEVVEEAETEEAVEETETTEETEATEESETEGTEEV